MNRGKVSNNLWGNSNKEIINASDLIKKRSMVTQYNHVKKQTNYVITNSKSRDKNKHTYGIGYTGTDTDASAAILTSRNYEDKYMISKAKCYASCDDDYNNIDYLKYQANNGNKLQVKYTQNGKYFIQILYTGNINSVGHERPGKYDMIQDPAIDGEGYIVKINHEDWIKHFADISYNDSKSFISEAKSNRLNGNKFTIKGPIEL
tara:strand:+ start:702 stop:1316 length:615 start_codon:yes stop_codon:yes gene_type:complete